MAIVPDTTLFNGAGGMKSAIGKNRSPFTWNLDLGAYYPIKFSENMQLRITADWFNVTNTQRAVTLDQTFLINSGEPVLLRYRIRSSEAVRSSSTRRPSVWELNSASKYQKIL